MTQETVFVILLYSSFFISNALLAKKLTRNPWLWGAIGTVFSLFSIVALLFLGKSYKDWLTVDEYIAKHPNTAKGNGIHCYKCGSRSIRSWGIGGQNDSRRIHSCNSCGTQMYRSGF